MRKEFSDKQKAQIYVRDRALCAFSGKSLWVPDYGLSPTWDIDWVDHIRPAAKGGEAIIDNGVCASYFYNAKKGANSRDNRYLFLAGKPTEHFYYHHEQISRAVTEHLQRFSALQISDWYFNRALFRFLLGMDRLYWKSRGKSYRRDAAYYARSALKMIAKWERMAGGMPTLEARGLLPVNPSEDQKALLAVVRENSEEDLLDKMYQYLPWYHAGLEAVEVLCRAQTLGDLQRLKQLEQSHARIPRRVLDMIAVNRQQLSRILPPDSESANVGKE